MQVFTELAETTPLALMLKENLPVNAYLDSTKAQKHMEVGKLSKTGMEVHAQMAEKIMRDHTAGSQMHNDKTHVRSPNFQVRDYVLVAEHHKSGTFKLQVKCTGPRGIANERPDYVFVVKSLLTKEFKAAHERRLRLYADKELNATSELAQAAKHNAHDMFFISKILGARYNEQEIFHELLVVWRGFCSRRDYLITVPC
jgi:hypothetical protein